MTTEAELKKAVRAALRELHAAFLADETVDLIDLLEERIYPLTADEVAEVEDRRRAALTEEERSAEDAAAEAARIEKEAVRAAKAKAEQGARFASLRKIAGFNGGFAGKKSDLYKKGVTAEVQRRHETGDVSDITEDVWEAYAHHYGVQVGWLRCEQGVRKFAVK